MVISFRHTGIVVRDINRSLDFYQNILGLKLFKRAVEKGDIIDNVTGIEGVELEWIKLKTPDNGLIELLEYKSQPEKRSEIEFQKSNKFGCSHIALTVSDINLLYDKLVELDLEPKSKPQTSSDGFVKLMYGYDPDGNIIEFVEEIKK